MTSRREFMHYTGIAGAAALMPVSVLATQKRLLPARPVPGTDELIPIVGLGNSNAFRTNDEAKANRLIDILLNHGGRYIDVGGSSAYFVGKLGKEKNAAEQLFLGNYVNPAELTEMQAAVVQITEAQGKTALDLVHTRDVSGYRAQHDQYRALKEGGLARYFGIARTGKDGFQAIGELIENGQVDFIQINYSMLEPEAADYLLPLAMDNGVAVAISRPFINGDYFSIVRGHELPEWAADFDCASWAQFSLKFILAHPAVTCVLTETADPGHALENIGAGFGRLPDENQRRRMQELMRGLY